MLSSQINVFSFSWPFGTKANIKRPNVCAQLDELLCKTTGTLNFQVWEVNRSTSINVTPAVCSNEIEICSLFSLLTKAWIDQLLYIRHVLDFSWYKDETLSSQLGFHQSQSSSTLSLLLFLFTHKHAFKQAFHFALNSGKTQTTE